MLLTTKFSIPPQRFNLIARPRLLAKLALGLQKKLTLVSAPAGFGKTTVVTDWLYQAEGAQRTTAVAWLALDEQDNDPMRFFTYLLAALQKVDPNIGAAVPARLQTPQPPALEALLTLVINDLNTQVTPLLLALDDYHVVSAPAIHQALIFLLDNLPPCLHLLLTTRTDPPWPLSRWRVQRELVEIRARDLRFTQSEAAAFLQQELDMSLTTSDIAALEQRTEGWIAGLQLAALSLTDRGDARSFIQAFTGSHAYIVDYLVEEVLQRQPPEIEQFLLQTSILDRLCAPLCDHLLNRDVGGGQKAAAPLFKSQTILEQLEHANLFLVPLDSERQWYRYHRLFAEVLRNRLQTQQPIQVTALHRLASDWYAQANFPLEALPHSVAAADDGQVAVLVEQVAEGMLNRGESVALQDWLARLPEAIVRTKPRLCLVRAHILQQMHEIDAAEQYLQAAEQAIRANLAVYGASSLLGEVAAVRVSIALYQRDPTGTIDLAQQALAALPADQMRLRGQTMLRLGIAHNWRGDLAQADRAYRDAARLGQAAGDVYTAILATSNYAGILFERGELRQAAVTEQRAIDLAVTMGAPQISTIGGVQQALAEYYYEWNDLETAARLVTEAIERTRFDHATRLMLLNYATLARVLSAQGDMTASLETLQRAEQLLRDHELPIRYTGPVIQQRIRYWLKQGNWQAAGDWLRSSGLRVDDAISAGQEGQYLLMAQVLLLLGEADGVLPLLTRIGQMDAALGRHTHDIAILALQAVALAAQNATPQAYTAVEQALIRAEPQGYIRTFVDMGESLRQLLLNFKHQQMPADVRIHAYVDKLLAAFAANDQENRAMKAVVIPSSSAPPSSNAAPTPRSLAQLARAAIAASNEQLIEPLTERELEVLHLLAQGLSEREIAEQLIIVPGTVKRHLNNLYGKLAVHSRTQALARAQTLHLL